MGKVLFASRYKNGHKRDAYKAKPCVYALLDPFTQEVRYVGATTDLRRRYGQHAGAQDWWLANGGGRETKSAWVRSLLRKGALPMVMVLEFCSERKLAEREGAWIDFYLMHGSRLTNWKFSTSFELPPDYQI